MSSVAALPLPYKILPINSFEHMMYADDIIQSPMTLFIRMTLRGRIEKSILIKAIESAVQRHPLLQSTIRGRANAKGKRIHWVHLQEPQSPYIDWAEDERAPKFPCDKNKSIDLRNEIGCRFFVSQKSGETSLLAQFHHTAVDGKGGTQILEDIMVYYQCLRTGKDPKEFLNPIDTSLLENRNTVHLDKELQQRTRGDSIARIRKYFTYKPEVLRGSARNKNDSAHYPTFHRVELDEKTVSELKGFSKERGVTINDALLVQLFRTINSWNAEHTRGKRGKKSIRIAMPVCMRRAEDVNSPAANIVSMCFLDRLPSQIESDSLYESVAQETGQIKDNAEGTSLLRVLDVFTKLRYGFAMIQKPTPLMPCHTTAVLSNLGIPLQRSSLKSLSENLDFGEFNISGYELMPPFRVNSPIAIGVATVNGKMNLTMNFDNAILTNEDAAEIMSNFAERIKKASQKDGVAKGKKSITAWPSLKLCSKVNG